MLSKEEYKRQLVRMWDSLRESRYKGDEGCIGVYCSKCPLKPYCGGSNNAYYTRHVLKLTDFVKIAEIVENWAKNHPVVTNADKFEETFGFQAPMNRCVQSNVFCAECEYYDDEYNICRADERFWAAEYGKINKEECDD